MARTKKTETAASEAVQDEPEQTGISQDTQEAEAAPVAPERQQEGIAREVIGPDSEEELLGCQDEETGDPPIVPLEYAVAGCDRLNLRDGPGLNARVITELPRGVGVSDTGQRGGEWWEVVTGLLRGWVMAEYLEPVWS